MKGKQLDDLLDTFGFGFEESLLDSARTRSESFDYPFPFWTIRSFLSEEMALAIASEIPDQSDLRWRRYENPLERKQLLNYWDAFGPQTYRLFCALTSMSFALSLAKILGHDKRLLPDPGLNGGGIHVHPAGTWLNTHRDYDRHPKIGFRREFNLIIFIQPEWKKEWGGELELWSGVQEAPEECVVALEPQFCSAVIFQTSGVAWHGVRRISPVACVPRLSLASYFLSQSAYGDNAREKALFHPSPEQLRDPRIRRLIDERSRKQSATAVYETGVD